MVEAILFRGRLCPRVEPHKLSRWVPCLEERHLGHLSWQFFFLEPHLCDLGPFWHLTIARTSSHTWVACPVWLLLWETVDGFADYDSLIQRFIPEADLVLRLASLLPLHFQAVIWLLRVNDMWELPVKLNN